MNPFEQGIELIKRWEGLRLQPYLCPAGIPTIGYGHVMTRFERSWMNDGITTETAEGLLAQDCWTFIVGITHLIEVPLTPNQASALLSWTYNLGTGNLRSSTLRKVINAGEHGEAPRQIRRWNKAAGRVLPGLVARREDEAQLYASE